MTRPLHVAFVWHMHQPYYKDDLQNQFLLPWVRLRCAKDYHKMPALLADYPAIKQTFNLVPALVAQVQDYADGGSSDVYLELARRPVSELSVDERAFVARWMTESSQIRRVREYPRYAELVRKREQSWPRGSLELARLFSDAELRDLQVWFNLSWIGPEVIERDSVIAELVRKGRDFAEADKEPIFKAQLELLRKVLPAYREVQERGQAELITSPTYHPILPLIADVGIARVARPDLAMPRQPFTHPDDAAEQLRRGVESHTRSFGMRPRGLWPPEQAISEEVVRLAADQGIEWMLSDEAILARSLGSSIVRDGEGQVMQPDVLYGPYRVQAGASPIHLLFRDGRLSNAIGFEYQNSPADEAAKDLVDRLKGAVDGQRHARERGVVGGADSKRLDVEPPPREQPGDPCQHTRLVLHEQRDDVLAARVDAAGCLEVGEVQDVLGAWLPHARLPIPPCRGRPGPQGSSGSSSLPWSRVRRARRGRRRRSPCASSPPASSCRWPACRLPRKPRRA